jgi:hypothetical protein
MFTSVLSCDLLPESLWRMLCPVASDALTYQRRRAPNRGSNCRLNCIVKRKWSRILNHFPNVSKKLTHTARGMIFKSKFVCLFPIGSNYVPNRTISQKVVLFLVQMLLLVEETNYFPQPLRPHQPQPPCLCRSLLCGRYGCTGHHHSQVEIGNRYVVCILIGEYNLLHWWL